MSPKEKALSSVDLIRCAVRMPECDGRLYELPSSQAAKRLQRKGSALLVGVAAFLKSSGGPVRQDRAPRLPSSPVRRRRRGRRPQAGERRSNGTHDELSACEHATPPDAYAFEALETCRRNQSPPSWTHSSHNRNHMAFRNIPLSLQNIAAPPCRAPPAGAPLRAPRSNACSPRRFGRTEVTFPSKTLPQRFGRKSVAFKQQQGRRAGSGRP